MNKVGEYRTLYKGAYITVPLELDIEQIKGTWRPTITVVIAEDLKFKYYIAKSSSVSDHSSLWFMISKRNGYYDNCDWDLIDEYKLIDGIAKQAYEALDKWYKENPKSVLDLANYQPTPEVKVAVKNVKKPESKHKVIDDSGDAEESFNQYALFDDETNQLICDIHGTQKHAIEQVCKIIEFFKGEKAAYIPASLTSTDIRILYADQSLTLVRQ